MPLEREIEYWEGVAGQCVSQQGLKIDNVWKRPYQMQKLLQYSWLEEKVLEIGHGNAMIAGSLRVIHQGHFEYTGTELSTAFMDHARLAFGLNSVQADVRELPGEGYTRLIAFDSLEHVRPEHRREGYQRMAQVAAPGALLFIHYSLSESHHDKEFDHPFGLDDLVSIEAAGFSLVTFDRYKCDHKVGELDYVFVVMRRNP